MPLALDRQQSVIFEEEVSFAARPVIPFTNDFFIDSLEGEVTETPTLIMMETGDGHRGAQRKETVSKIVTWRAMFDAHPKNMGWLHKWACGTQVVVDSVLGTYRYTYPTPINVELKSFTMYIDSNKPDYYAAGQQLLPILGCKIGTMSLSAASGDDEGRRFRVELTGIGQKPQVITRATVVVLTFGNLTGETITLKRNGVSTTITEGVDFTAVTSNNVTATNIATAIDSLTGLEAVPSAATVTVTLENGFTLQSIVTTSATTDLTAVLTTTDVLMGGPGVRFSKSLLHNSVNPTPPLFQNLINQWAGLGYTSANKWKSASVIIENVLEPRTYASESTGFYLDDIFLRSQRVTFSFDKDFSDAVLRIHDWRNSTEQNLNIRLTHKDDRLANGDKYRLEVAMPRATINDANPLISFGGGDEVTQRTFTGEALVDNQSTDVTNTATGTDNILEINTAFVQGIDPGDADAVEFLTVSGGYLNAVRVKLKTTTPTETANIFARIYTDDGGGTSRPDVLVPGGISNLFSAEILTESYQSIFFDFPNRPKLDAATVYWIVIHTTSGGSLTMRIDGDAGGSNSHASTIDGGISWALFATPDYDYEIYVDVLSAIVDLHVETSASNLFPDSI